MDHPRPKISVVTPTFLRPAETLGLLRSIRRQTLWPLEVILVDGSPLENIETENAVRDNFEKFPFKIRYLRYPCGTAIQRNAGIDVATGEFIALIDDDVRLEEDFLERIVAVFNSGSAGNVGGIVGYRGGGHFTFDESARWRWYRRLRLLTIFEPGRYDFQCGYPINNYLQPPFQGVRPVDFMTTACAVWRRQVFDDGLRFDRFFSDFGVLEDAHLSLRAGLRWELLQCGDAHCTELNSPNGRVNRRRIGYKCVVNYYFVFQDIVRPLSKAQKLRFWRYQSFEFLRIVASAVRRRRMDDLLEVIGRLEGVLAIMRGVAFPEGKLP